MTSFSQRLLGFPSAYRSLHLPIYTPLPDIQSMIRLALPSTARIIIMSSRGAYNKNWSGGRGGRRGFSSGGGYRGRGGSNASSNASAYNLPPDRDLYEGLKSTPLKTFAVPEVATAAKDLDITDVRYLGSYNWVKRSEDDSPAIIVPGTTYFLLDIVFVLTQPAGSPSEWNVKKEAELPFPVPADVGVRFKDQNGYQMPNATLQPLLVAVDQCTPAFDWSDVDFVTDRNGLRKLLRWISYDPSDPEKEMPKKWRIDVQLAGAKTVLMSRWEDRHREVMPGYTFGFNFEEAMTTKAEGCGNSSGHHRIITYVSMMLMFMDPLLTFVRTWADLRWWSGTKLTLTSLKRKLQPVPRLQTSTN